MCQEKYIQSLKKCNTATLEDADERARDVRQCVEVLILKYGFEILTRLRGEHKSAGVNGQVGPCASDRVHIPSLVLAYGKRQNIF